MKQKINIREGYSLHFLIHAFFVMVAGILLFKLNILLAIGVIIIGIMLLLVKTGLEISCQKKYAFAYRSIFGFRVGRKNSLKTYDQVRLKRVSSSTEMQSRGPANVIKTKVFLIQLMNDDSSVNLYEFGKYKQAQQVFNILVNQLSYKGIDEEAELRAFGEWVK